LSTLGKILTVMVALVAIAVAVLVAREFVLTRNWKAAYDEQVKVTAHVAQQRDTVKTERDKAMADRVAERGVFETKVAALNTTIGERDRSIATLTEETLSQARRLQDLATTIEGLNKTYAFLVSERVRWLKERDEAVKTADQFTSMYSELVVKYRTDQANIANLKADLIEAQKTIADLQGKIALIAQMRPDIRIPEKGPYPPVPSMNGLVTSIDNASGVAEINLGSDSGVTPGTVFVIYHEPGTKFLAELTIKKVGPKTAAGSLSTVRGTIEVNDHVQNKPGQ